MTNLAIITGMQVALYRKKKLKLVQGEIEPIHTYAKWKSLGYTVKKGEHAITKFPVWKMVKGKVKSDEEEKEKTSEEKKTVSKMIMKNACFFSLSQVEKTKN